MVGAIIMVLMVDFIAIVGVFTSISTTSAKRRKSKTKRRQHVNTEGEKVSPSLSPLSFYS